MVTRADGHDCQPKKTYIRGGRSRTGALHRYPAETIVVRSASFWIAMRAKSAKGLGWLLAIALLHAGLAVPLQAATACPCVSRSLPTVEIAVTGQSSVVSTPPKCHENSRDAHCLNAGNCLQGGCGLGHCGGTSLTHTLHYADFPLTRGSLPALVAFGKDWASSPDPKPPRQLHCA